MLFEAFLYAVEEKTVTMIFPSNNGFLCLVYQKDIWFEVWRIINWLINWETNDWAFLFCLIFFHFSVSSVIAKCISAYLLLWLSVLYSLLSSPSYYDCCCLIGWERSQVWERKWFLYIPIFWFFIPACY